MANGLTFFIGISATLMFLIFIVNLGMEHVISEESLEYESSFANYDNSQMSEFDNGNYTLDDDLLNNLPTGAGTADVDADSGNVFTDTFKTIKNWLYETSGAKFIMNKLKIIPNFLKFLFPGDLAAIGFGIGVLWQVLVGVAFVVWLKGGRA